MLILCSLMACVEPSMKRINELNKRIERSEDRFKDVEKQFDELVRDYARVDSILRNNNTPKKEMLLFSAYLQQFEDVREEMIYDINYSSLQLKNLEDDIKDGRYDDAQREEYLDSEESVIKMIEARIDYFYSNFNKQKEFVKSVR